ncbi:YcxB family protein [Bacillus cereus group sp. N21]|nr:YcxB family protein [Bacillus cereus group sp. N21]
MIQYRGVLVRDGGRKMQVEYTLTEQDFIAFNLHYARHSKMVKRSLVLQHYIVAIILFAVPLSVFLFGPPDYKSMDLPFIFLLAGVIWIVFYPKCFYKLIERNIKKMLREGSYDNLIGKHNVQITDEGIIETNNGGETKLNWKGIEKVEENEAYIFIYVSSMSANIVPKHAFVQENSKNEFMRRLRAGMESLGI